MESNMKSVKCPACGFVGWADSEHCKKCGAVREPNTTGGDSQQPQPSYLQYQAGDRGYAPAKLSNGLAITSLVLGIVSLFTFGLLGIGAIAGITLAIVAIMNAKRHPHEYGGQGLAIAGLITSTISLMILPFGIVMAIAIPNLLASRRAANEGASISALRTLHSAEQTYQATRGNGAYGTLDQLAADGLINPELARGTRYGYKFRVDIQTGGYNEPAGFQAVGVPVTYGDTGVRSFYIDETGVIRAADNRGAEATGLDPPLDNNRYSSDLPRSPGNSYDSRDY